MDLGGITHTGTEKVFLVSTTHGGETHAIAAGLATLEEFQTKKVIEHNHELGRYFSGKLSEIVTAKGLASYVEVVKSDWLPAFTFKNKEKEVSAGYRTLAMQEMISHGVLFQGIFLPCFSHTKADVDFFADGMSKTLDVYAKALESGYEKFLIGPAAKPVFRKIL